MITRCRRCRQTFWRYRRDHPPPGFCSLACKENRQKPEPQTETPATTALLMAAHRMNNHPAASATEWFTSCEACARLEERHAQALSKATQMQEASTTQQRKGANTTA